MAMSTTLFVLLSVVAALLTGNIASGSIIMRGDRTGRSNCQIDPCQVTQCYAQPDATCIADYTEGCKAKFYLGRTLLSLAQCGIASSGRTILRDDTENEGSPRTRSDSPPNPSRTRSGSLPNPSRTRSGSLPNPSRTRSGSLPNPSRTRSGSLPNPSRTRSGSPPNPPRTRSGSPPTDHSRRRSPPPSLNRRSHGSSNRGSTIDVDSEIQRILERKRQAEVLRARQAFENEIRSRQQSSRSSGRGRSMSRNRSRGNSRMGSRNRSRSQSNRSRSSRRRRPSGGLFGRFLRG